MVLQSNFHRKSLTRKHPRHRPLQVPIAYVPRGAGMDDLLEPESFLPEQQSNNIQLTPEQNLIFSIMQDVLLVLFTYPSKGAMQKPRMKTQMESDMYWIKSTSDEPFTFVWICQHLDIDPDVFRTEVLKAFRSHLEKVKERLAKNENFPSSNEVGGKRLRALIEKAQKKEEPVELERQAIKNGACVHVEVAHW
jgi:hypothetical protein